MADAPCVVRGACARRRGGEWCRAAARVGEVPDEGFQLPVRACLVGGVEPLLELVHVEAALGDGVPQPFGDPLPLGVGGPHVRKVARHTISLVNRGAHGAVERSAYIFAITASMSGSRTDRSTSG